LLDWVARDGATVSRDTGGSLVVADVLLYADGGKGLLFCDDLYLIPPIDKTAAINALLAPVAASYPSAEASAPHPIDLAHTSRLYKTLLQGGHFSHASKAIERSPYFDASAFAHAWVQTVGRDVTQAVACGDGAFVVAELCARLVADGPADSRTAVRGWFADKDARKRLAEWEGRGKEVLREKVDALLSTAD
jgi:pumilio family protein 6